MVSDIEGLVVGRRVLVVDEGGAAVVLTPDDVLEGQVVVTEDDRACQGSQMGLQFIREHLQRRLRAPRRLQPLYAEGGVADGLCGRGLSKGRVPAEEEKEKHIFDIMTIVMVMIIR